MSIIKTSATFFDKTRLAFIIQTPILEYIEFLPRNLNPLNVPKVRPVEDFWGHLSAKVYEGGWQVKNEDQLKGRIRAKIKEFELKNLQSLLGEVKKRLRSIADNGYYSVHK